MPKESARGPTLRPSPVLDLGWHVLCVHLADVKEPFEAGPEEGALFVNALRGQGCVDGVAKFLPEQIVLAFGTCVRRRTHLQFKNTK